ncbi:hypothetical protein LOTGIDRAFT_157699 [Lottia gigantea]|uniref:Secreted protein n=1 Tax=Lottia gigantea TaxID=225164 RepID=V4B2E0_LOTGI|nr:hypothetical protein LOTGIDRAFT_157699 [Lottia gigantea]ESP00492.1 hypothetical protein LOTGIDRAFT_157699 [Lottia gigantea]
MLFKRCLSILLVAVYFRSTTLALLRDLDGLGLGDIDHILDLDRGCRCQAIDNNGRSTVLQDFGRIQACGLGLCGCDRGIIGSCRQVCERIVEAWAANTCPAIIRGLEVKALFRADDCAHGLGDNTHDCHGRGRLDEGIRVEMGLRGMHLGGAGLLAPIGNRIILRN